MNFISRNKLIILILTITLVKGVIWSYATPLFQAPDEQVHYASVQYYAEPAGYQPKSYDFPIEKTDMFNLRTQNLSPELKNFLERTQFEKVRFHKEKTMDFRTGSLDGNYENDIRQNSLGRFVEQYPAWVIHYSAPYYVAVAGIENLFGSRSIIERVYLERLFSVVLLMVFVLFSYLTFRELSQSETVSALLAGVVSFQPMLTFITSSINVDTLLLAAFGVLIYGAVRLLKRGPELASVAAVLVGTLISFFTKPPGYFALAEIILLLLIFFFSRAKSHSEVDSRRKTIVYPGFLIIILTLGWAFFQIYRETKARYFPGSQSLNMLIDYIRHQISYPVLYGHSTFYWGNFGWLDTPITQPLVWLIWLFLGAGFAGVIYYFGKGIANRKSLKEKEKIIFYQIIFLLLTFLGFSLMIHAVNFQQVNPSNVADESGAIAIQGRYFFPVMGAKFFLVFWGVATMWKFIVLKIKNLPTMGTSPNPLLRKGGDNAPRSTGGRLEPTLKTVAFIIFVSMVLLNLVSLFVYLIPRFYLGDGTAFFSQELLDRMSQYKPVLLKEWVIVLVFIVYLALLGKFLLKTGKKIEN